MIFCPVCFDPLPAEGHTEGPATLGFLKIPVIGCPKMPKDKIALMPANTSASATVLVNLK